MRIRAYSVVVEAYCDLSEFFERGFCLFNRLGNIADNGGVYLLAHRRRKYSLYLH